MKWSYVTSEYIEDGLKRYKFGFLWFPKYTIQTGKFKSICEWRWLEKAVWEERYTSSNCNWETLRWVESDEVTVV